MSEIDEKFEKFKKKPLDFLEKLVFINLTQIEDVEITARYIELLIEIQKIKKDCVPSTKQNTVLKDKLKNTNEQS